MNIIDKLAKKFILINKRLKRWQRQIAALAAVVVFATTYAMILPAITLDSNTASTQDGIEVAEANEPAMSGEVYEEPEEEDEQSEEQAQEESEAEEADSSESSSSESGAQDAEDVSGNDADGTEGSEAPEASADAQENDSEGSDSQSDAGTAGATDAVAEDAALGATDETAEEMDWITEDTRLVFEYEGEEGKEDGYIVYADFGASAKLPKGVELQVREITAESDPEEYASYYEAALSQMQDKYDEYTTLSFAKFYDIAFVYEGVEVEPSGNVAVRIEYKKALEANDAENIDTVHFDKNDEEKVDVIDSAIDSEKKKSGEEIKAVEFESDQFSVYGVVGTEVLTTQYITAEGETYTITVTYSPESEIPKGAELRVVEIRQGTAEYDAYYQKALKNIDLGENPDFPVARLFDISIIVDGEEVQPKVPVEVSISLSRTEDTIAAKDARADLSFLAVHVDEDAELIETSGESNSDHDEMSFEAAGFSPYMLFGYRNTQDTGKFGVTNTDNVAIKSDHYLTSTTIGNIEQKGTKVEIIGDAGGIFDGLFSQWYEIRYGEIEGYVQKQFIDVLEAEGKLEAVVGNTKFVVEGLLPEGAALTVAPSELSRETVVAYFRSCDRASIHSTWAYDISIQINGISWQPAEPLMVTVTSPDITVGEDELLGVLHVEEVMGGVPEYWVDFIDHTFSFEAEGFSPYVFYTAGTDIVAGERVVGTNWMNLIDGDFFSYWEQFLEETDDEETEDVDSEVYEDNADETGSADPEANEPGTEN